MRMLQRLAIGGSGFLVGLFLLGFVMFAEHATRTPKGTTIQADGIVVLTGGSLRIREGARLLEHDAGKRLLITGVNRRTGRKSVRELSGLRPQKFACCVDLGYEALDTVGNADETRAWAKAHGYRKLIIVTSSYHMPRSLAELALEMPEVTLVPHAVIPKTMQVQAWWLDLSASRLLASEYVKFLPSAARLAVIRVSSWGQGQSQVTSASRLPAPVAPALR